MSDIEINIHQLDAQYKPFPTFTEWQSRTTVDTVRWGRYNSALELARKQSPSVLQRALQAAKRAAAIDTGAIEGLYEVDRGFTYTIAFELSAWETSLTAKGEQVRPLFEAQLHAYDYVLDLATKSEPISEAAIRTLHEVVCEAQSTYRVITAVGPQEQPLPKGQYKVLPNHVRTRRGENHSYAPVDVTPAEMDRLVRELRSETFLKAHPVIQAAYAHYCLVVIHPFADGNGRVARALASAFTYRSIAMPIIILSEQKNSYLDILERADNGNYQSFVDFLLTQTLDTMRIVEESVRAAITPSTDELLKSFESFYLSRGGYTPEQIDTAGKSLLNLIEEALVDKLKSLAGSKLVGSISQSAVKYSSQATSTHRPPLSSGIKLAINLNAETPAATESRQYILLVPRNTHGDEEIQVKAPDGSDSFFARVDEIIPAASGLLRIRIAMFAERVFNSMLLQLRTAAEEGS